MVVPLVGKEQKTSFSKEARWNILFYIFYYLFRMLKPTSFLKKLKKK